MKRKNLTRAALLLSLCIVLGILENLFVLFPAYPGIKLGLANVCIMYALFSIGFYSALNLGIAKSLFALITRGVSAGILSLSGTLLSILVMYLIISASKNKASIASVSVSGGILHNLGQLAAVSVLWKTPNVFSLSPILIVSGTVFGILNALLLRVTLPYLNRIGGNK